MFKPLIMSLALSLSMVTVSANASPQSNPQPGFGDIDLAAQCPELNLTEQQKDQFKQIRDATAEKLKAQKQQLKEAKKNLMTSLADVNVTQEAVVKHEQDLKASVDAILDTVFQTTNQVVFSVLTKEQRAPGVACFQKIKKDMAKKWLERKCAARGGSEGEESETDISSL